jgi:oxygen-independent coproporphyrinogen-3 oxidase
MSARPADLLAYATANLPRYTSYPTAPHFRPLEEADYRGWLAAIAPDDRLSLYVHIPFCRRLCWYCGCHTAVTRSAPRLQRYAAGLAREAETLALALPPHAGATALHFGGGTPTAIGADALASLIGRLRILFAIDPAAEIAVEMDPRGLDEAAIAALGAAGVTRASLGVQDVSPEVQAKIGRIQTDAEVATAVRLLRAAGIGGINLDLMYGLPGQTVAHVEASARFAADLGADRVAVFGYAHVPWMKSHQAAIRTEELPGALERMAQAEAAERILAGAGYVAIGLDHFARPGDPMAEAARAGALRRNFQGYTTDAAPVLLGLGASAIGHPPAGFAQNDPDERRWLQAVEAGRLAVVRGRALTEEDRLRGALIERVMGDLELDLAPVPASVLDDAAPRLASLERDGIIEWRQARLVVTAAGRRFVRHVAAAFDAYLESGAARHSRAV